MAGHLFITRGSVLGLACDAILIPSGTRSGETGHLVKPWSGLDLPRNHIGHLRKAPSERRRVVEVRAPSADSPAIWAGHTGESGRDAAWYVDAVLQFVDQAGSNPTLTGRPLGDDRPLLAVPLVGTGKGGYSHDKGDIVRTMVERLISRLRADTVNTDVALVLFDDAAYAAAQAARDRHLAKWPTMSRAELELVRELAEHARAGNLVLFMGAGVSIGAGLPSWSRLLDELSEQAGLTASERRQLGKVDPRDAAAIIGRRMGSEKAVTAAIKRAVHAERASLVHQLLASLPVREALTTNYDTLFERAWKDAGAEVSVLPRDAQVRRDRWLVKLHGSVDHAKRPLVLSRDDYVRFEGTSAALAGIVQAVLLTRHLLFVGYSLSDENFHRIVHQVRESAKSSDLPGSASIFGTVLTPEPPRLIHEVWKDQVRFISTSHRKGGEGPVRRMAILLDRLGAEVAAAANHLMDTTYTTVFNEQELELRNALEAVETAAAAPQVRASLKRAVAASLRPFGGGQSA